MKAFVAGATGDLGRPLVRRLVQRGHEVIGLTRSDARRPIVESTGARAIVADALDGDRLAAVVKHEAPTHVVHLLTALPAAGPMRSSDLEATNLLRREGTKNLLGAAISAGARLAGARHRTGRRRARLVVHSTVERQGKSGPGLGADPLERPRRIPRLRAQNGMSGWIEAVMETPGARGASPRSTGGSSVH